MENPSERHDNPQPYPRNNGSNTVSNPRKGKKKNNHHREQNKRNSNDKVQTATEIVKSDENLCPNIAPDPRGEDPEHRMTKKSAGRNSASFDPMSTLVRPALRVQIGSPLAQSYNRFPLKHDDVVIVPELFGREDDWKMYYKLLEEMTELQQKNIRGSEWLSWHEGAHLVVKNPKGSKTFKDIIDKLCEYFQIEKKSIGTRFNWYKDSSDWKPFHHDSA